MLDVVEDVRNRPDRRLEQELLLEESNSRQAQLIREQQQRVQLDNRSGKKISAVQLLSQSQSQKVVLLGAPGSGKTTLMSYFAVMLAQKQPEKLGLAADIDWLPILIRIRDLARHPNLNILDYARQFAHNTLCVNPSLPPGFFEYWLEDGRALILLDGLDEVPEEGKRDEVVRYIENFLGQFERNRAIITSRPAGYRRDFFRTDEFPHYEIQPFDDAKIEEFINRWYDSRIKEDKPEAKRCKDSLRKALSENARIKLLARNPLLLTIIALIHRYRAILPKQRHELYDKAVETLLKSWDAKRELSHHKVLKYLELDDLRRLMESVAYWIHTQASTGDKESGTLIDRDELIEQLSREIKTLKQIKLFEAKEEAKRFVNFIRERTGLLNEQGQDCYAFVHKTFQEYLCAQEIIYQADNEDDFDIILNHIRDYLHDSHWREVLLLLIAQQKPKKAARAIRTILDRGSEYEQWLHRDLLFAGSCLAENPKGLKGADNGLSEEILEQLVELEVDKSGRVGDKVRQQVFQILCSLNQTDFEAQALQLLKDRAACIDQVRFQEYRAALGEKEEAIATLLVQLADEDDKVHELAARALGNIGDTFKTIVIFLLVRLIANLAKPMGFIGAGEAGKALVQLGNADKTVVNILLALLECDFDFVRSYVIETLGELGNSFETFETIVNDLLAKLENSKFFIRSYAAEALGELGNNSERIVNALLLKLEDNRFGISADVIKALGKLGNSSNTVVDAVLAKLEDEDFFVRLSAANVLGTLDNASERVVSALMVRMKDDDTFVSLSAASALCKLGKVNKEVLDALLAGLEDTYSYEARSSAAAMLGRLGNTDKTVIDALLVRLEDEDFTVRFWAASALRELGYVSESVVSTLLKPLAYHDEEFDMRSEAVNELGTLGNADKTIVDSLLAMLLKSNSYLSSRIAEALGNLSKKSNDVLPAVTQWISQHQDSEYVGNGIDALWNIVVGEQN